MFTAPFWKSTAERVVGTAAAAALPTFIGANVWEINYAAAAGITISASVVTFLKCIIATSVGDKGTPSLVKAGE